MFMIINKKKEREREREKKGEYNKRLSCICLYTYTDDHHNRRGPWRCNSQWYLFYYYWISLLLLLYDWTSTQLAIITTWSSHLLAWEHHGFSFFFPFSFREAVGYIDPDFCMLTTSFVFFSFIIITGRYCYFLSLTPKPLFSLYLFSESRGKVFFYIYNQAIVLTQSFWELFICIIRLHRDKKFWWE